MKKETAFEKWFEAYARAKTAADPAALAGLFSEDAAYLRVDPFDAKETLRGRATIQADLTPFCENNENFRFLKRQILSSSPELNIARCRLAWVKKATLVDWACDFIMLVTLDDDNRCTSYQEWDVVRPKD